MTPIAISVARRPQRSIGQPPNTAPTTVPHSALEIARPCSAGLMFHTRCTACSAPEITAVSKPNRNPASAATSAQVAALLIDRFLAVPAAPIRSPR